MSSHVSKKIDIDAKLLYIFHTCHTFSDTKITLHSNASCENASADRVRIFLRVFLGYMRGTDGPSRDETKGIKTRYAPWQFTEKEGRGLNARMRTPERFERLSRTERRVQLSNNAQPPAVERSRTNTHSLGRRTLQGYARASATCR